MIFLLQTLQFILLISTTNCALNIHVNLAEEFLKEVYDHIYVQCEQRVPRSNVYKFCTSLEGRPCELMLKQNSATTKKSSLLKNEFFFFEEFFSNNELDERFSLVFLNNIEWLINHVGIFSILKDSFFDDKNLHELNYKNDISEEEQTSQNISTLFKKSSRLSSVFQQFNFLFRNNFFFKSKNEKKLLQYIRNTLNKEKENVVTSPSFRQKNSFIERGIIEDYEIHSTVVFASNHFDTPVPEFYGSDYKTLSLRWVGLWYNLPYTKLGLMSNKDLEKNKNDLTQSCIFVNRNDNAILFSKSVVPNNITVLLFHKKRKQAESAPQVVIYVQGILCETKQKGNEWIYTPLPLKCLKNYEYQRAWSAKLLIKAEDHLKQINILDYITAGFQYTRIDGILISLAEMTKVQVSEGNLKEILTQSNQIDTHGLCLQELHVRYSKKKKFTSEQEGTASTKWKRDTRKALVLVHKPLVYEIPAVNLVKNQTPQQTIIEDREKWTQYWSAYIKKQIFKRAIQLSLFNKTSHDQLVNKISHQYAPLPFSELSSDGYVFHHDMRPFSKSVQFWRHNNIPIEAPLCRIKTLHQQKYILPFQLHPSTLVTTESS